MTNSSNGEPILPDFGSEFFSPFGDDTSNITPIKPKSEETLNPFNVNPITGEKDTYVEPIKTEQKAVSFEMPAIEEVNVEAPVEMVNNPKPEISALEVNAVPETQVNFDSSDATMVEVEPIAPIGTKRNSVDLSKLLLTAEEKETPEIIDPVESIPDILDGSIPQDPLDKTILQYEKENKRLKADYQEKSGRLTALLNNNRDIFERVGASSRELSILSTQLRNLAIEVLQSENQSHMSSLAKLDEILAKEEKKQQLYSQKLEENRKKMGEIEAVMSSMKRRIAYTKTLDRDVA